LRLSGYFLPTLKEIPREAKEISHILLLKSGLIKPLMSGVYEYLPLGWRVIKNIQKIIREEMDRIGGQELLLPVLTNREIWDESKRWDDFGKEMFKFKDRSDRDVCLAPTHEEIITDLARREIQSYRELPQMWYQIQTKFRDEPRPKGAVLRIRQFIMKDSYSLDRNREGLDRSFNLHYEAYTKIFKRCGLDVTVVGASSGLMGGSQSNEFMFLSNSGEDTIAHCNKCDYAANMEVATTKLKPVKGDKNKIEEVETPVPGKVNAISKFLGKPKKFLMKSLLYIVDGKPIFILIRGDHNVNETKLTNHLGLNYREAKPEEVRKITGADIGYISPVGIKNIDIYADNNLKGCTGLISGANKNGYHIMGIKVDKDLKIKEYIDVINVKKGDPCPACNSGKLKISKAIELGHIFKLGTKYSKSMKSLFTDEDGTEKPIVMGSYGIGIERIMASVIDKFHDKNGIIWPVTVAPFLVHIIPLDMSNKKISKTAEVIYTKLTKEHLEVIIDDRDERPGFKFKDADLIGIPVQIVLGKRSLEKGVCEVKLRGKEKKYSVKPTEITEFVEKLLNKEKQRFAIR
jgi:prolyl-tRNA synthetase